MGFELNFDAESSKHKKSIMNPSKEPTKESVSSGLFGPYQLTKYDIQHNLIVEDRGVFALGFTGKDGVFYIDRIGRSEKSLMETLIRYEGMYQEFKFKFFSNEQACYEKECQLYHLFKPRDNIAHPSAPKGTRSRCPACGL